MSGDPVPGMVWNDATGWQSALACQCAMCVGNYACGGFTGAVDRLHAMTLAGLRVGEGVPNRLKGASINHEGDAV